MSEREPGLPERLAAFEALMDAIVPESRYYQGEREDSDRMQLLADAVEDPASVLRQRDAP